MKNTTQAQKAQIQLANKAKQNQEQMARMDAKYVSEQISAEQLRILQKQLETVKLEIQKAKGTFTSGSQSHKSNRKRKRKIRLNHSSNRSSVNKNLQLNSLSTSRPRKGGIKFQIKINPQLSERNQSFLQSIRNRQDNNFIQQEKSFFIIHKNNSQFLNQTKGTIPVVHSQEGQIISNLWRSTSINFRNTPCQQKVVKKSKVEKNKFIRWLNLNCDDRNFAWLKDRKGKLRKGKPIKIKELVNQFKIEDKVAKKPYKTLLFKLVQSSKTDKKLGNQNKGNKFSKLNKKLSKQINKNKQRKQYSDKVLNKKGYSSLIKERFQSSSKLHLKEASNVITRSFNQAILHQKNQVIITHNQSLKSSKGFSSKRTSLQEGKAHSTKRHSLSDLDKQNLINQQFFTERNLYKRKHNVKQNTHSMKQVKFHELKQKIVNSYNQALGNSFNKQSKFSNITAALKDMKTLEYVRIWHNEGMEDAVENLRLILNKELKLWRLVSAETLTQYQRNF